MFKNLKIKNYQSHAASELNFEIGVNALVGTSDSGKSSIIRALNWIVSNRPRGNSYIRHGSDGECSVLLTLTDGTIIERYRKGGTNHYKLNGEILEALGSDVPQEISNRLNIDEINLSAQFDTPFMVFDSPGKISTTISNAVHLEDAEKLLDDLSSRIRSKTAGVKDKQERIEALETSLKRFDGLDGYKSLYDRAKALQDNLGASEAILDGLSRVSEDILKTDGKLSSICIPEGVEELLDRIGRTLAEGQTHEDQYGKMVQLAKSARSVGEKLNKLTGVENALELARDIENVLEGYLQNGSVWEKLETILQDIDCIDNTKKNGDVKIKSLIWEYNELMAELDICPACEQSMDNRHRDIMLENMR